jgi:hypothetical protein
MLPGAKSFVGGMKGYFVVTGVIIFLTNVPEDSMAWRKTARQGEPFVDESITDTSN